MDPAGGLSSAALVFLRSQADGSKKLIKKVAAQFHPTGGRKQSCSAAANPTQVLCGLCGWISFYHSQKTKSIIASETSKFYGLICAKNPFLLLVLNLFASRASQGCPYPNHLSYLTHDPRPLSPPPKQSLSSVTHCPSPEFMGVPFGAYSTLAHGSRKGAPGVILAHVLMLK